MATISQFKAQMQGGGARPNQFRVQLTFPAWVGSLAWQAIGAGEFLCRAASLPGSFVEDITTMYRGRPVHFAGERTFQPWLVSVYNDNDFLIRRVLERWSNGIANYSATIGRLATEEYQTDMLVQQLDRNDKVVKQYTFYDAYPAIVGPVQLAFDQNNQIEEFEVEFIYNYFTTDL